MLRISGLGRKEAMMKIVAVVLFFCFAECAAGSCLNYGHACWGAHGKRSGNPIPQEPSELPRAMNTRWFLSKLVQSPIDFRYFRDIDFDMAARHNPEQLFSADDIDAKSGQEQWHKNQDVLSDDQLFDDNFLNSADSNRIRIHKVLDKRSTKQN
ncbi:uncharacterized protein CCHa1 [Diabrotica undecimpunctata]|uniref:uncharacterized protein CCHa1 n=1 Tax=Diabrotica undecimpunctata TaxID=50387 RepID=UPI003B635D19